jgi:hypothetical protein
MYTFDSNGADNVFVKSISACLVSCQTPTPTPTITATQTSTPTSTPTVTPTNTPTTTITSTPGLSPTPTRTPAVYYSFSACCDGTNFNLELGDLTPSIGDTYYFTSGDGLNSFSGCASVITSNSGYELKTVNTAQSYETCEECTADHPCCECERIIFTGSETNYNVRFIDCDGITQEVEISRVNEAYCVSANTEIISDGRSFYYDGCCECGNEVPCERWAIYANSGSITFNYTACDGMISGITVDGSSVLSAFVCIEPGTESYISTGDASANKIGCCCECNSYSITGNTTWGTTVYGVRYCGDNFSQLPITIPPGDVIQICVDANYFIFALVDSPGPLIIYADVESLGCCNVSP